MQPIDIFSLARHEGPYDTWPRTTALRMHGRLTGAKVPGYVLQAQYRCAAGYLLATSWDCPYEEMQTFALLSSELELLGQRNYGAPYGSVWLLGHEPVAADTVAFHCDDGRDVVISVRAKRPFLIGPLLKMRVVERAR
jgi:hypothetical protein